MDRTISRRLHPENRIPVTVYRVPVQITPREGILDPQGTAIAGALRTLGFPGVRDVRVGRFVIVDVDAGDAAAAREATRAMCDKLLANPVIEDYTIDEAVTG